MTPSIIKTGAVAAAIVLLGATSTVAQQAYDPMQALRGGSPSAAADSPEAVPDPELGNLPAGPGAEETYYQCVACHSTAIIRQQRLSDERWDYLWTWMVEDQGMPETDEETREIILGYLKTHFSSESAR